MTTRGIRRKKSYLVDAKIAVCGQKSVGKSGKIYNNHTAVIFHSYLVGSMLQK